MTREGREEVRQGKERAKERKKRHIPTTRHSFRDERHLLSYPNIVFAHTLGNSSK